MIEQCSCCTTTNSPPIASRIPKSTAFEMRLDEVNYLSPFQGLVLFFLQLF